MSPYPDHRQQPDILSLKPEARDARFLEWIQEARKRICESLALSPEQIGILKSNYIASYKFEDSRKGPPVVVTIGYGLNGSLISRVESETKTSSRLVSEEQFFKSPFGTMMMEAQWFWRTYES